MNILERADKYAEGKANEVITKAIAEAYIEGYKAGYNDREAEIPLELRDNKTEYVDLGLPSRTLWSIDYEKLDGNRLYLPYEKAECMKIPTKEQWEELINFCQWEWYYGDFYKSGLLSCRCVGPNGQILEFDVTGLKETFNIEDSRKAFFWIEDDSELVEKNAASIFGSSTFSGGGRCILKKFSGYKLPVRLVR